MRHSPIAPHFELSPDDTHSLPAMYLAERLRRRLLEIGYGRALYEWSQLLAPSCDARERLRLQQLVELAFAYQAESTLRPSDFISYVEETKVSDPTTAAVRVMTVHQAKGLEFDIVFLPELDARLRGQTPTFVVSRPSPGEPIDCVCRYANENVQQLLPASFQQMFTDSLANDVSEALCVLYVSLTRAIHALQIVIRPINEKEKAHPKTFAGLVRAALCNGSSPKEGVLFEHGERDWYARTFAERSGESAVHQAKSPGSTAQIKLAPSLVERRRGLQRESPSQLEGGAKAKLSRLFELVDSAREQAMLRGTAFHAFYEQIRWLNEPTPHAEAYLAALLNVPDMARVSYERQQAWLAEFLPTLQLPAVAGVLTQATYLASLPKQLAEIVRHAELEVQNEWPFAMIEGTQLLQGRMDRVVFLKQDDKIVAVDVLDYKTDFISPERGQSLAEKVEHYRPQMEAYRHTLSERFKLPPARIAAGLIFVGSGQLVRL